MSGPVAVREELQGDGWRTVRVRGTKLGLYWRLDHDGYWYAGDNPFTWKQLFEFDGPLIPLAFNGPVKNVLAEIVHLRRQAARLSEKVTPKPAQDIDVDLQVLAKLVENINGAIYHGDRLNAIVDTVMALRENPDLAKQLLGGAS